MAGVKYLKLFCGPAREVNMRQRPKITVILVEFGAAVHLRLRTANMAR